MELSEYTIEELKAEIKRRSEAKKAEKEAVNRCKNCKFRYNETWPDGWFRISRCSKRSYFSKKQNREINYAVNLSQRACDKYERQEN